MKDEFTSDKLRSLALRCGLSGHEWEYLLQTLGRTPTSTEIQMIGVMWSEHCSYKSSKHQLKRLLSKGKFVLEGPGENAGLVSLDKNRALAFKVESHNHPSFVEPFQGAATGVGGILRDIFTMGARPIAVGNYLRFGDLSFGKHRYLLSGVVSGIAHYGNCMGIPTVAGHIGSNSCYQSNILVNVFALGIAEKENLYRSSTALAGHTVMLFGAKTGRDGIHGASLLASADFSSNKASQNSKEQKIRVQVGDPFKEKVLMEATLEVMKSLKEDLLAIQDMGAAGLTCSTMEISYKSRVGMSINLNKVPARETGMQAYELLLSESQERMLAVVRRGSEEKFKKVFSKWGCECEALGETTDSGRLRMEFDSQWVVDLQVADVMDPPQAALPKPELTAPRFLTDVPPDVQDEWEVLKSLVASPSIASKQSVFESYDSTVGASTVLGPGHEAAVLWVGDESQPHLGVAFKGVADEDLYQISPGLGAKAALSRAVECLAAVGSRAIAYTDGINLGNPNNSRVQGALEKIVEGLNEASQIFETPCVSGNVSMYNQTQFQDKSVDIFPTTFIVAVGTMADVRKVVPSVFQKSNSEIWVLEVGDQEPSRAPSFGLYTRLFWPHQFVASEPILNLRAEKRLQEALLLGASSELFLSSRVVSSGGLAVALVKSCVSGEVVYGFDGDWSKTSSRRDYSLFNEDYGRVIVEIDTSKRATLLKLASDHQIHTKRLGQTTEDSYFRIAPLLAGSAKELLDLWKKF